MTLTRRVLILIAAMLQASVIGLLLYASYFEDLRRLRQVRDATVHSATRADIDSPFSWKLSWSDWDTRRGLARVSFAPNTDHPRLLSQFRAVRGAQIRLLEHWRGRCDDPVDSEEKVVFLQWRFGDSDAYLELPVTNSLCTHMTLTFIESEPRSELLGLDAIVQGESDAELEIGAGIGLVINHVLLALGFSSTYVLLWGCCTKPRRGSRSPGPTPSS